MDGLVYKEKHQTDSSMNTKKDFYSN